MFIILFRQKLQEDFHSSLKIVNFKAQTVIGDFRLIKYSIYLKLTQATSL